MVSLNTLTAKLLRGNQDHEETSAPAHASIEERAGKRVHSADARGITRWRSSSFLTTYMDTQLDVCTYQDATTGQHWDSDFWRRRSFCILGQAFV
jgi:hypothetical protein